MKVLIATVGTRGDIQPYIGLSEMLIAAGHAVTIASSRAHQRLIDGFKVPFYCIDETPDTSAIQQVMRRRGMRAVTEGVRMLFDGMLKCHERLLEAAADADLVIGHGWVGEGESEALQKRFIRVGISPNIAEKVKTRATSMVERLRIDIERLALNRLIIEPYNDFLRKVNYRTTDLKRVYEKPLFLPISKVLLDSTNSWNNRTYQSSYWYADDGTYSFPTDIGALLANGRKTVLFHFGSMTSGLKIENTCVRDICNLADEMDCNLIWVGLRSFADEHLDPHKFAAIEEIPLSRLLPEIDVAFHHCGLGTTSEVIRSGCPSVPVPFIIDQHGWAKRLVRTGAATEPIRPDQLTAKHVGRRLRSVFDDDRYKTNAGILKVKVLEESEEDETVKRIESICES